MGLTNLSLVRHTIQRTQIVYIFYECLKSLLYDNIEIWLILGMLKICDNEKERQSNLTFSEISPSTQLEPSRA